MPLKIKQLIPLLLLIIFQLFNGLSYGQEKVVPLEFNPVLHKSQIKKQSPGIFLRSDSISPFRLDTNSFFDDFSESMNGTNKRFWIDDDVFINNDLAYRPISVGVATFDGLDQFGNPYQPGDENSKGQIADKFTSVPIDLSIFQANDSIYLSFFYQPVGLGDMPEEWDSLALEFKPVRLWTGTTWDSNEWVRVWRIKGSSLKPFKQVIIQVKPALRQPGNIPDTIAKFYHQNFQFRFVNYGNRSGNMDHWNLDYVYLAKGRSKRDTAYNDIAVVYPPVSILKKYMNMPWKHLVQDTSAFTNTLQITGRYLGSNFLNFRMGYLIQNDKNGEILLSDSNTDSKDLFPGMILSRNVLDKIKLSTKFPFNKFTGVGDRDTVLIKTTLFSVNSDFKVSNSQAQRVQEFSNYYAYDDGTAEAGYGIELAGYNVGKVAYKFTLSKKDTLRGIAIYFNQSKLSAAGKPFDLLIWKNDYNLAPAYRVETYVPNFTDSVVNDFYIYEFDTNGFIVDGTIYIGWEQRTEFHMNVGLDNNYYRFSTDSFPKTPNANLHYFWQNQWRATTQVKGALMMRPIFGSKFPVSVKEDSQQITNKINIYPNPANDFIYLDKLPENSVSVVISDIQGKDMIRKNLVNTSQINVSDLNEGFYILRIFDHKGKNICNHKIIIKH